MFMFIRKRKFFELKKEISDSFENVKKDFSKVGKWINLIDDKSKKYDDNFKNIHEELSNLKNTFNELSEKIYISGSNIFSNKQSLKKQTTTTTVQTAVQTAVQMDEIDKLTIMERAIVFALINSNLKLSHDDLSVMFGKSKSTIRGQINSIKQKIFGLIDEYTEPSGKKRIYISDKNRDLITKKAKIHIKNMKSES